MKNRLVKYGIITGVVVALWVVIWGTLLDVKSDDTGMSYGAMEVIGFLSMFLSFITIFIAHKKQIDESKGVVGFWPLLRSGLIISVVASIIYVTTWMIVYENGGRERTVVLSEMQEQSINDSDIPDSEKKEKLATNKDMMEAYDNNAFFRIGFTFVEILPVGIFLSLISAAIFYQINRQKESRQRLNEA